MSARPGIRNLPVALRICAPRGIAVEPYGPSAATRSSIIITVMYWRSAATGHDGNVSDRQNRLARGGTRPNHATRSHDNKGCNREQLFHLPSPIDSAGCI